MGKLDDQLDSSFDEFARDYEAAGGELARKLAGGIAWPVALWNTCVDHFRESDRRESLLELLRTVVVRLKALESELEGSSEQLAGLESRLGSEAFLEAWVQAAEETLRTSDRRKTERFSLVLAGTVDPRSPDQQLDDLPALIRDLAQLGELDLKVLDVLCVVFGPVIAVNPNMHDPNAFTEKMKDLLEAVGLSGMDAEAFYSHCARLNGFGLAMEVLRNPSRMSPGDYCFRPTRRGLTLNTMIQCDEAR